MSRSMILLGITWKQDLETGCPKSENISTLRFPMHCEVDQMIIIINVIIIIIIIIIVIIIIIIIIIIVMTIITR